MASQRAATSVTVRSPMVMLVRLIEIGRLRTRAGSSFNDMTIWPLANTGNSSGYCRRLVVFQGYTQVCN